MCDCGDTPETYRVSRPRAKREHKCCECGGTIRAGETYRSFGNYIFDSQIIPG